MNLQRRQYNENMAPGPLSLDCRYQQQQQQERYRCYYGSTYAFFFSFAPSPACTAATAKALIDDIHCSLSQYLCVFADWVSAPGAQLL